MKKRKSRNIGFYVAGLLILAGILVILYPIMTDRLYQIEVKQLEKDFIQRIQKDDENAIDVDGLYQELKKRNELLYTQHQSDLKDPFSYEQPDIDLSQYGIDDNIIGFLEIPKMDIQLPIYLGANKTNMTLGAVHLTQTSYPIGGENTNSVIAAHRGYSKTAMFRDIEKLKLGDRIYIRNFKETLTYEVVEILIIDPNEIDQLLIQEGKDLVTLVTCHPLRSNKQRYVVFCQRIVE